MAGEATGRKVAMINPNWDKGYIDKHMVVDYDGCIRPMGDFCLVNLTAYQELRVGDRLIRIRHMLKTHDVLEDHFLIDAEKTMVSCSKVSRKKLSDNVKLCITYMRDPAFKMFPTHLPGEIMELKKYDCNVSRKARFISVLDTVDPEMYNFILEQLKYSYNSDTPADWRSSRCRPLPKVLNSRERLTVDSSKNNETIAHTSQHWLLIMHDGSVQWDNDPTPTSGGVVDVITGKTLTTHTAPARPIPSGVKRAVKITIGLHHDKDKLVGVGWSIYEDKPATNSKK